MSERESIQNELVELIEDMGIFNAPYGVLPGLNELKRGGKVRTITFGVCRVLDATIFIWSPKNIRIEASGGLSYRLAGKYESLSEVKKALENIYET